MKNEKISLIYSICKIFSSLKVLNFINKEKYVKICPKCGSTNVKSIYLISPVELSRPGAKKLKERLKVHPVGSLVIGWQPENPSVFICKDCDYNGICPEIEVSKIEKFRKKLHRKNIDYKELTKEVKKFKKISKKNK